MIEGKRRKNGREGESCDMDRGVDSGVQSRRGDGGYEINMVIRGIMYRN